MPTTVIMPQLGESVVEGTVNRWLKAEGETVDKLEPLLEIATDKIDTEVPAPVSGVLLTVLVAEGQTVDAGTVLAYIGAPHEVVQTAATDANLDEVDLEKSSVAQPAQIADTTKPADRSFVSPVVARLAAEHNVKLGDVQGSGINGRITKKDVLKHLEDHEVENQEPKIEETEGNALGVDGGSSFFDLSSTVSPSPDETLHPLTTMRRAIAQHMVLSKRTSPHVTTVFEVDMTAVVRHREANRALLAEKGIRLTFTPYFVMAAAVALDLVPELNARFSEEGVWISRRIHIGVAVAVEDGLFVPVLRDADEKKMEGLSRAINDLTDQARTNQLSPDQLKGATFTITNYGTNGSLIGTPIINQPQAGILGVGAIVKRPVVQSVVRSGGPSLLPSADDAIVIHPMCYLSLTFDHRVLDGARADKFLSSMKKMLEDWTEREK